MGRMFAQDLSEMNLDLNEMVAFHLRANCYPPVPLIMVAPCVDAITACNEEEFSRMIELPQGVEYKNGIKELTASFLVNEFRLEEFISYEDEFEEFQEV